MLSLVHLLVERTGSTDGTEVCVGSLDPAGTPQRKIHSRTLRYLKTLCSHEYGIQYLILKYSSYETEGKA